MGRGHEDAGEVSGTYCSHLTCHLYPRPLSTLTCGFRVRTSVLSLPQTANVQLALRSRGQSPLELRPPVGHHDELVVVPLQGEAKESSISCDVVTRGVLSADESHDFLERCVAGNHAHGR